MNLSSLFMLIPLVVVILIAVIMVVYKKGQKHATRRLQQQEPHIGRANEIKYDVDDEQIVAMQEDDFANDYIIDPLDKHSLEMEKNITNIKHANEQTKFYKASATKTTADLTDIEHEENKNISQPSASQNFSSTNDLIIMGLVSKPEHPYTGYELLQALLSSGLRYGKMNIFHRYEDANGRGNILFSLASAKEPGTFELSKMGGFSTSGLTLFMRISAVKDPLVAFEIMQDTALQLIEDLDGEICDEKRQPITEEKIIQWREHVQVAGQRQYSTDLFS
jgi:cell division protein ZipA